MEIRQDIALQNFEFWGGAKDRAAKLTGDQFDNVEEYLEEIAPEEGWTDTELNDTFWFDFDSIVQHLGYDDEEHFDANVSQDDVEEADSWFNGINDTDEMLAVADFDEDKYREGNGDIDDDRLYDDFTEWWNSLSDIEQVETMRKNDNDLCHDL